MFKPLAGSLKKKTEKLDYAIKKADQTQAAFSDFVKINYPKGITANLINSVYGYKDDSLTVFTRNKSLATDLSIKIPMLSEYLSEKSIVLKKIIIK